ncbi:hypothetical protein Poly51_18590 [Rubripirellula tenax]|uniref:Uncharacterized protein n=1 Tax=Rubripirellula tenax TaxID=2528015 RepID=A0A5C6FB81_9BACT|nr:hypothetical protein [Rubripirellula tenax]TWU59073.1 hypothetical protein Poly51_18590 [Rubripirellula tenax]
MSIDEMCQELVAIEREAGQKIGFVILAIENATGEASEYGVYICEYCVAACLDYCRYRLKTNDDEIPNCQCLKTFRGDGNWIVCIGTEGATEVLSVLQRYGHDIHEEDIVKIKPDDASLLPFTRYSRLIKPPEIVPEFGGKLNFDDIPKGNTVRHKAPVPAENFKCIKRRMQNDDIVKSEVDGLIFEFETVANPQDRYPDDLSSDPPMLLTHEVVVYDLVGACIVALGLSKTRVELERQSEKAASESANLSDEKRESITKILSPKSDSRSAKKRGRPRVKVLTGIEKQIMYLREAGRKPKEINKLLASELAAAGIECSSKVIDRIRKRVESNSTRKNLEESSDSSEENSSS